MSARVYFLVLLSTTVCSQNINKQNVNIADETLTDYSFLRGQNLRQGIVMKTSFKTRVSRMGLGSFVDINFFVMKYYFI